MTRRVLRTGVLAARARGRGARGAQQQRRADVLHAGQVRARRGRRHRPRRHLDPGRRLRRPARAGPAAQPGRHPAAGRDGHPHRRRDRPSASRATAGSRSPATAPTGSTRRSTSVARSCSARRSRGWSGSSPTTSSWRRSGVSSRSPRTSVRSPSTTRSRSPTRTSSRRASRRARSSSAATTSCPSRRIRKNLAGGDFDRSANQQRVLKGFQAKVAENADKPGWIENGVLSVIDNVHTNLNPAELFEIAQAVAQVDPKKITGCVVPGGIGNIGGASVVLPTPHGQALRRRRPQRRHHQALLSLDSKHCCKAIPAGWGASRSRCGAGHGDRCLLAASVLGWSWRHDPDLGRHGRGRPCRAEARHDTGRRRFR